jgi:hypothetical protein
MKILGKRGQVVANLQGFIMAIVTIGVVLAIGLYVLQEVQTATEATCPYMNGTTCQVAAGNTTVFNTATDASTATGDLVVKLGTAPTWIGLLIVVVFASAILAYFYFKQ